MSFADAVIIMTSNVGGVAPPAPRGRIGFAAEPAAPSPAVAEDAFTVQAIQAAREAFSDEFFNRIQRVVVFQPLGRAAVREIIDKIAGRLRARLTPRGVSLRFADSAYDLLMETGYSARYGAGEMERAVERLVEEPLGRMLLDGRLGKGSQVVVSGHGGEMRFDTGGAG